MLNFFLIVTQQDNFFSSFYYKAFELKKVHFENLFIPLAHHVLIEKAASLLKRNF